MLEVCTYCNALVEPDDYVIQKVSDIVVCRHCSPEFVERALTSENCTYNYEGGDNSEHDTAIEDDLPF